MVSRGDAVMIKRHAAITELEIDGEKFGIVDYGDLLGVMR